MYIVNSIHSLGGNSGNIFISSSQKRKPFNRIKCVLAIRLVYPVFAIGSQYFLVAEFCERIIYFGPPLAATDCWKESNLFFCYHSASIPRRFAAIRFSTSLSAIGRSPFFSDKALNEAPHNVSETNY